MDFQDIDDADRGDGIDLVDYNQEMRHSFVTYAMSVIVSRALPDVRDGLKPVHRRILYGMQEGDYHSGKPHKKSARIVGDVMGKYHPHGDQAIYDAFVRLAQPWKVRHPIVDGQGNFGSPDGDPPAAMRYTEARMTRLAHELTADLDSNTVAFRPNYDEKDVEPVVLPARYPNLLVNGQAGIAVGMATNIPTHNLREVIDATLLMMDNPSVTVDDILAVMPGPDFPTSGIIMGRSGIRQAYETGNGSIMMSGVLNVEPMSRGRSRVVISELPYDVNKESLIEKVAEFIKARSKLGDKRNPLPESMVEKIKTFEGITDIRDESDREIPVRIVIEVRADADPAIIINGLRRFTEFQTPFSCNMTCLASNGKPEVMGVQRMLQEWIAFRRDCVRKRTMHELDKARDQQVKQIALYAATSDVDEVVRIIRASSDADTAVHSLMNRDFETTDELRGFIKEADPDAEIGPTFRLNIVQANAILALTLKSLTGLERDKIADKLRELAAEIRGLLEILNQPGRLDEVIRGELARIRERFGNDRLTQIETTEADEIDNEDLVERKDIIVSLTRTGYVKRTELGAYRSQRRGGKGKTGMETKDDDFVISSIVCTTRTPLLVFTEKGQVYALKAYRLPDAPANHKGRFIGNFVEIGEDRVTALVPLPEDRSLVEGMNLVFITSFGTVRRNSAKDFLDINRRGKIAMKLEEGGIKGARLVAVLIAGDGDDVLVATAGGNTVRFPVEDCRVFQSRDSSGVRAITLKDRDEVVDATILVHSDPHALERDAYLNGGMLYVRERDLLKENGERREFPDTLEFLAAPEPEKEDRVQVLLSAVRMEEMRREERFLLTVTANGFGKRSSTHDYRLTSRGGVGLRGAAINEQTGPLVACLLADDGDDLMVVTDGGQAIRTRTSDVRILGRDTRGVRLLSVPDGQRLVAVARIPADEEDAEPAPEAATAA